jgi:carbonic anhydrase
MNSLSKPGKPLLDIQLTEKKMAIEGSQTGGLRHFEGKYYTCLDFHFHTFIFINWREA